MATNKKRKTKTKKRQSSGSPSPQKLSLSGRQRMARMLTEAHMGIYTEYLEKQLDFRGLATERQNQLKRISALRNGRDVLVIASDLSDIGPNLGIEYADLLSVNEMLQSCTGTAIDVVLETPGGSGEIAEDIVQLLHDRYREVGIIVPGAAKSAGTIMAMAGDEILMEPVSALGPIDAQLSWQGKVFSADAFLEGLDKIKAEVAAKGLNPAYIPILQGISPGEIQSADNALNFAKKLVTQWLNQYKFKDWLVHSSSGTKVTDDERMNRAKEIAEKLCDHKHWLTHGRSIKIADLEAMRLRITNYADTPDLADAIRRYYTLLRMTFESNIYKVFETPTSQILKARVPQVQQVADANVADQVELNIKCSKCGATAKVQANLQTGIPIRSGMTPFPVNNKMPCPNCKNELNLLSARRDIEAKTHKKIV